MKTESLVSETLALLALLIRIRACVEGVLGTSHAYFPVEAEADEVMRFHELPSLVEYSNLTLDGPKAAHLIVSVEPM